MSDSQQHESISPALREAAEARLRAGVAPELPAPASAALLHELRVHQAALDIQTEKLEQAHRALKAFCEFPETRCELIPVGHLALADTGLIVDADAAVATLLGTERKQLLQRRFDDFVDPEYCNAWRRHFQSLIQQGGDAIFKLPLIRHDATAFQAHIGSKKVSEANGVAAHLLVSDVTKCHYADRVYARLDARLEGILDTSMDAIISVDDTQHIRYFNNAAQEIFGWRREQVLGAPLDMLIPERFRQIHANHIQEFGKSGVARRHMDGFRTVGALHRDGTEFTISAAISQLREDSATLYTVVLRDITRQVNNEDKLIRVQEELREFALASNQVREIEKRRIARELHDELGQALTALKMDTAWVMRQLVAGQEAVAEKLTKMQGTLDSTVAAMRRIAANLRPLILDDLGFRAATEALVESFKQHTGIDCRLGIDAADTEIVDPFATEIFRILQESLTNIAKHAHASLVEISVIRNEKEIRLMVRDNGAGFDPADPQKPGSYGLMGFRERAYLMGGTIHIDSKPGRGTTIELLVPLAKPGKQT